MSPADAGGSRVRDIALVTAAAFVAGGYLQRLLAADLEATSAGAEAFSPWMLAPILVQGVVGFFGLAWALRDRYPLPLVWAAGSVGWALASTLALALVGWSFYEYQMLFLVGLAALVMATMLRVGASIALRLGAIYTIGFTGAWAALVLGLAATVLAVQAVSGALVSVGLWVPTLAAVLAIGQDFIIGTTAAIGAAWASRQAPQRADARRRSAQRSIVQVGRLAGAR